MKKYTKEIAAIATMALFAPWANAQDVTLDGVVVGQAPAVIDGTVDITDTVTIQAAAGEATFDINDDGAGVNPSIPDDLGSLINPIAETTPVYTQLGGAAVSEESFENSGIIAETNGDLTLLSNQGEDTTFSYIRAVRNDVNNFDQPNPGASAQVQNVGGYMLDPDDDPLTDNSYFVELGLLDLAENWDADFIGTPLEGELILDPNIVLTPEQEALLITNTPIPGDGGNLQVGGNANVDGVLSLGLGEDGVAGTADDSSVVVEDVALALDDNATAISDNADGISDNADGISDNADGISDNASDIDVNELAISDNASDIDVNELAISDNADGISDNVLAISDNADGISDNADAISDNVIAIDDNASDIQQEIDDRTDLIRRDADGVIHVGEDSFLIDDSVANHVLTTNSGTEIVLGGDIAGTAADESKDIRIANDLFVDGNANVDGILSLSDNGFGGVADVAQAINGNAAAIAGNTSRINKNERSIDENRRGIAMVAALQHTTVLPGMTNALDVAAAHFEGETGMSINYSRRLNENWQLNFGAASTTDFDESVVKVGAGVQW